MAENQKDRYIQYLAEQNQDLRLTSDAMELVLEDFMAEMKELKAQMVVFESNQTDLQKELSEKSKLCKSLERKRNWPMLMSSFLVISVRRQSLNHQQANQRRQIQTEARRKMIMTEPMIRIRFNNMLYGSDAGAEMAATYHSVIGTVKLHGSSVWNFIGTFFKNIFQSLWLPANVKFKTN